ncbi:MAG: hypothetical protein ACK5LM_04560 [Lactovum sp.]
MEYYISNDEEFKFYNTSDKEPEEVLAELSEEPGNIFYTTDNTKLYSFDHEKDQKSINIFIIVTIAIIFVVPVAIILITKFKYIFKK